MRASLSTLAAGRVLPLLLPVTLACSTPDATLSRDTAAAAALLDAEDSREIDAEAWSRFLAHPDPELRRRAARGIGRIRAGALVPTLLEHLPAERSETVRDEILFALGQIGDASALPALEEAASGESLRGRALAVEALGKLRLPDAEPAVRAALDDPEGLVRREALYALVRLRGRRVDPRPPIDEPTARALVGRLAELTGDAAADVRFAAAYALAETPLPDRDAPLLALLENGEAHARLFAARALGRIGRPEPSVIRALVATLDASDPHAAAAAATALTPFEDPSVDAALVRAVSRDDGPASFHVRTAAVGVLAARVDAGVTREDSEDARAAIGAAIDDPSPTVRRAALVAVARIGDLGGTGTEAARRAVDATVDPDPWTRVAAMHAAAYLVAAARRDVLDAGLQDADPRVVSAALATVGRLGPESPHDPRDLARAVLAGAKTGGGAPVPRANDDLAVRAAAVALLAEHGTPDDVDVLAATLHEAAGPEGAELRVAALEALAAAAGPRAARQLAAYARDPSPAVAATAARLASGLGATPPPPIDPDARRSSVRLEIGRDVLSTAPNPRATLETDAGVVEIELLREEAPRHVASFAALARDGAYDGLTIHRVVTGFVVQGLDPRGDGWGSGGVFLRDEINRVRYARGSLGMPNAGPDTAGCQIFVTHVPAPHLDGRYTVFGRVTRGLDVIDALEVGTVVRRVTID